MAGGKERRWRCHYDFPIIESAVEEYCSAPAGYAVRVWLKWKIRVFLRKGEDNHVVLVVYVCL